MAGGAQCGGVSGVDFLASRTGSRAVRPVRTGEGRLPRHDADHAFHGRLPARNTSGGETAAGSASMAPRIATEAFELECAGALELRMIVGEFEPGARVTAGARTNTLTAEATGARTDHVDRPARVLDRGRRSREVAAARGSLAGMLQSSRGRRGAVRVWARPRRPDLRASAAPHRGVIEVR